MQALSSRHGAYQHARGSSTITCINSQQVLIVNSPATRKETLRAAWPFQVLCPVKFTRTRTRIFDSCKHVRKCYCDLSITPERLKIKSQPDGHVWTLPMVDFNPLCCFLLLTVRWLFSQLSGWLAVKPQMHLWLTARLWSSRVCILYWKVQWMTSSIQIDMNDHKPHRYIKSTRQALTCHWPQVKNPHVLAGFRSSNVCILLNDAV